MPTIRRDATGELIAGIPRLLTPADVATLLGVDPATLTRWAATGDGPRVTRPSAHTRRYRREDVHAWLHRTAA